MLNPMNAKKVVSILIYNEFILKRQTGSHKVFRKDDKVVIVPFHPGKDIPIPTLKSIIKQSGLDISEFM